MAKKPTAPGTESPAEDKTLAAAADLPNQPAATDPAAVPVGGPAPQPSPQPQTTQPRGRAKKAAAQPAADTPAETGEPADENKPAAKPAKPQPAKPQPAKAAPAKKKEEEEDDDEEDEDDEDDEDEDDEDDDDEDEDEEDEHPQFTASQAVGAFSGLFNFMWPFIRKYPKWLAIVLVGIIIETSFNVAFPLSLKYLIDEVLENDNRDALIWILATLGILGIVVSITAIIMEWYDSLLMSHAMADVRSRLFQHLQALSAGFYSRTKIGSITSRFGSDLGAVDEAVSHFFTWGFLPLMELIAGIGLTFYLNWQLALIALLVVPVSLIGPRLLSGRAVDAAYQERKAAAGLVAVVQENISAQNVVKAFELRKPSIGWFEHRNAIERRSAIRHRFFNAMVERTVTIAVLMLHLVVFGIGAYLTYTEQITLGTFVTFESVFWELSYNIGHVTQFIPVAISGSGATHHINELLDEPARSQDPADWPGVPRITDAIRFENVDFTYGGEQKQLDNVSFVIPAGSRVAFVGPSGSGKSTVMNVLMRLYDPAGGVASVDGIDITKARRDSLREQMGIVFQENVLFDISIRENIRLGNPGATDKQVEEAAKQAEIHKFIRQLPDGYDTVVGERGNMLSGGQRQRIAIARAIIRDPAILLLDEATSALDHGTEQAINRTLMKVAKGRTMISVTHRLHSVTEMDQIFVLQNGRIVERGTHPELMKMKGLYAELFKQAG
jgi:ATP-binding cassette subfamily B protein